jgi:hypothetical protein
LLTRIRTPPAFFFFLFTFDLGSKYFKSGRPCFWAISRPAGALSFGRHICLVTSPLYLLNIVLAPVLPPPLGGLLGSRPEDQPFEFEDFVKIFFV